MKERQSLNPRDLCNRQNRTCIQGSAIAAEISGYCDLGMKRQALQSVRRVLAKRRIFPEEFSEAIRAIGIFSGFDKWRADIEPAYRRQSRLFKRKVRADMLAVCVSLGDWRNALEFVSVRRPSSIGDFLFGMDVLLELGKIEEAEALALRCKKALRFVATAFDRSSLLYALGRFFAYTDHWEHALAVWQETPPDSCIARNVLSGIVEIHLARALEAVEAGIRLLTERKRQQNSDIDLCVPGLEFDLAVDAEKELLKFKRGIEKLLPDKVRKQLGIISPDTLTSSAS
jgi:hypothetical protein